MAVINGNSELAVAVISGSSELAVAMISGSSELAAASISGSSELGVAEENHLGCLLFQELCSSNHLRGRAWQEPGLRTAGCKDAGQAVACKGGLGKSQVCGLGSQELPRRSAGTGWYGGRQGARRTAGCRSGCSRQGQGRQAVASRQAVADRLFQQQQ